MRARRLILLIGVVAVALPGAAASQQLFDFLGQTLLPGAVGETLTMYSVVRNPAAPATTPIPLDFANYEYTLVISDLVLDVDGNPQSYSGGTIAIYEDAATAADPAVPGTYTDGTAVLTGVVTTLTRMSYTATMGSANGYVDWTGGTRLDDIAPQDQTDWPLLTGTNSGTSLLEPGYDEVWDGKVEPQEDIVPTQRATWGDVRKLYR